MSEVSVSGSHAASAPESPEAVIAALQAVIVELRARVADLERQLGLNSGNSGKPPSSDGPKKKPARVSSLRGRSGKKPGGQPGHPGNTLRRSENPAATVDHFPEACAGCGAALSELTANGHTARQVFDLPEPQPLLVTEHRARACRCTACGSQTRADFPEGVSAPVQYGPRIAAIVLYLQHYQLLPEKRLAVLMADLFGVRLVADSATKRRDTADFDTPAPFGAGTSPSGSRTARPNRRVETLISIRFMAHLPSKSSDWAAVQLGKASSPPAQARTRGRLISTMPPWKPTLPRVFPHR